MSELPPVRNHPWLGFRKHQTDRNLKTCLHDQTCYAAIAVWVWRSCVPQCWDDQNPWSFLVLFYHYRLTKHQDHRSGCFRNLQTNLIAKLYYAVKRMLLALSQTRFSLNLNSVHNALWHRLVMVKSWYIL